jgi:hypothetical protein
MIAGIERFIATAIRQHDGVAEQRGADEQADEDAL